MTADDRIRSDGGIDALDPPPTDIMDEETLDPEALAQNAPKLETVVQLLNQPALARVYVYVCYWGPVSPPEIMDGLELSKSTTYEYIDQLVDLGLVDRDDSIRPQQLTADPIIIVEQYVPIVITPTVLHALALQEVDEDVESTSWTDTELANSSLHCGVQDYTLPGKQPSGWSRPISMFVRPKMMMIIYALEPALTVGRTHDPFFEHLFPDVHDQMDLSSLDEVDGAPAESDSLSEDVG